MVKKIMIYKGASKILYANGVNLVQDQVVPVIKREIIREDSLYYRSFGKLINMEYDTLLPSEEEATTYVGSVISKRSDFIKDYLINPKYSDDDRKKLFGMLAYLSSCVYFDPWEIHPYQEIPKSDFEETKQAEMAYRKRHH